MLLLFNTLDDAIISSDSETNDHLLSTEMPPKLKVIRFVGWPLSESGWQ